MKLKKAVTDYINQYGNSENVKEKLKKEYEDLLKSTEQDCGIDLAEKIYTKYSKLEEHENTLIEKNEKTKKTIIKYLLVLNKKRIFYRSENKTGGFTQHYFNLDKNGNLLYNNPKKSSTT